MDGIIRPRSREREIFKIKKKKPTEDRLRRAKRTSKGFYGGTYMRPSPAAAGIPGGTVCPTAKPWARDGSPATVSIE